MGKLPCVLWSYKMTVHTDTKETPFKLMFGQDAVIPMEIEQTSNWVLKYLRGVNDQLRSKNLDLFQEEREMTHNP